MSKRLKICKVCTYAYSGPGCTNPGCYANPNISEDTKAMWRERRAKADAEQAERDYIARIRSRYM